MKQVEPERRKGEGRRQRERERERESLTIQVSNDSLISIGQFGLSLALSMTCTACGNTKYDRNMKFIQQQNNESNHTKKSCTCTGSQSSQICHFRVIKCSNDNWTKGEVKQSPNVVGLWSKCPEDLVCLPDKSCRQFLA